MPHLPEHPRLLGRTRHRVTVPALAAAVLVCVLGGCDTAQDRKAPGGGRALPSAIAPGRPGERAETLSPEEAAKRRADDTPNTADLGYVHMMIEHHAQAVTMTELAPDRAGSMTVKRLAARIAAAQRPEIEAMSGWLRHHGGKGRHGAQAHHGGTHGHAGAPMPGMATEAQLTALRRARGTAFDELFLKLMIAHHQGAVTMATEVLSQGDNTQVEWMASDVLAQQTIEIDRMRAMS